jgi:hypothetical protein
MSLHANISQQAYNKTRDDDVQGYDYIQQLSNRDSVVYINSITHHVIIGFKGTNSASDIVPDLAILSGTVGLSPHFKRAVELYDKVHSMFPPFTIDLTGHSLGGTIAEYVNKQRHISGKVVNFNPGRGIAAVVNAAVCKVFGKYKDKNSCGANVTTYRAKTDLVSLLPEHEGKTKNINTGLNPVKAHKLSTLRKAIHHRNENLSKGINKKKHQ